MKYYKMKSNENVTYIKYGGKGGRNNCDFFVANELFTEREIKEKIKRFKIFSFETNDKKINNDKRYYTKDEFIKKLFDIIEVKQSNTYIAFGVRKVMEG